MYKLPLYFLAHTVTTFTLEGYQMGESKIKRPGLVASSEILNPKSKVNTFYLITVKSEMFCNVNNF